MMTNEEIKNQIKESEERIIQKIEEIKNPHEYSSGKKLPRFSIVTVHDSMYLKKFYDNCYVPSKGQVPSLSLVNNNFKKDELSFEDFFQLYSVVNCIAQGRLDLTEFPPAGIFNESGLLDLNKIEKPKEKPKEKATGFFNNVISCFWRFWDRVYGYPYS